MNFSKVRPFSALSYAEQLHRLEMRMLEAISRYRLPPVQHELLQYEDNAVYRLIDAAGERYVLRLGAAAGQDAAGQQSEMAWLSSLRRNTDLHVPEPVENVDGVLVSILEARDPSEPRCAVLMRWVPGEHPPTPMESSAFERLGEITARMHQHAEHFAPAPGFVRPSWDLDRLFNGIFLDGGAAAIPLKDHQFELLSAIRSDLSQALGKLRSAEGSWGLIHGDLHRDNILIDGEDIGIIDFDDCGWGFFAYDLASVLDSAYRRIARDSTEYRHMRDAFLAGYHRIRPLPIGILAQLRVLKVARDLVTLDFILRSSNAEVRAWGPSRIGPIMKQLCAYLDGSPSLGI